MQYIEGDVQECFGNFAEKSNHYSASMEEIRTDIKKLQAFNGALQTSINQIFDSIMDVKNITSQNKDAISVILNKRREYGGYSLSNFKPVRTKYEDGGQSG